MFKYFYIITFLITHDLTELKEFWRVEFLRKDNFKWSRLFKKLKRKANVYMFWYRLAYVMYRQGSENQKKIALKINENLNIKYSVDISLKATINVGLHLWHVLGIVITERAIIGHNCQIASNVVIGYRDYDSPGYLKIGNNVIIGANSMLFGDNIEIGNNVVIGAMSFINKPIPDNCTVYTEKTTSIITKTGFNKLNLL